MQITIQREDLLKPISIVAGVVERRQTLPILSYVMLRSRDGRFTMTGTDLEVEVSAAIPLQVADFELTVPARKLFDICRAIPAEATITLDKHGDKVLVRAAKSRFSLLTLPAADFPTIDSDDLKQALTIEESLLKTLLDQTQFCMAQQDVRYYLNGLYLEFKKEGGLRGVATDGHRMAIAETLLSETQNADTQIIIPRKGVQEIARLLSATDSSIRMFVGVNHIRLEVGSVVLTSKLIDGRFPDYTKVVPATLSKTIHLERGPFREALGRVAILSNEKYRGVRLNLQPGKLSISAHNPEQEEATEDLDIDYKGEGMEIGFNVNYLTEAVSAIHGDELVLGLNDPNSSCAVYSPAEPRTQYIIMPMRL